MKYTITSSQPSMDINTGKQYLDQYGNRSFNVMLQDEQGQSTSILKRVKQTSPDPKVGDILEGTLEMKTSQKGNTYYAFVPEKKEFGGFSGGKSFSDPASYIVSYAKDIVVALIAKQDDSKKLTTENIKDDLDTLAWHLKGLYDELKDNKPQATTPEAKPAQMATSGVVTANDEAPMPTDDEIDTNDLPF